MASRLRELPLRVGRLKTGTPPRIDGRSIDFSALREQHSDDPRPVFSYLGNARRRTRASFPATSPRPTSALTTSFARRPRRSPLFTGLIEGVGPRYCPSVEDKVVRFADKQSHQIFVEPEGLDTHEIYPNGISTSLPFDVQQEFVRTIAGFEHAHITRPGYAIEYDFFDPRDLKYSLESKSLSGLFSPVRSTAPPAMRRPRRKVCSPASMRRAPARARCVVPEAQRGLLGVLVDDLITRGAPEPYRMFTSRAEYRLSLREDNADLRLTAAGRELGLIDDERWDFFQRKRAAVGGRSRRLAHAVVHPADVDAALLARLGAPLSRETHALDLLRRPSLLTTI